jgi:hypothetical protein
MTEFDSEINAALSDDGPVLRENVLQWIDATADSDLPTLSKLYRLTGEGYYRIQPELGMEPTCALIQRYLLGCIRKNVTDTDEIENRFEACMSFHLWLRHLIEIGNSSAILAGAASAVTQLFLESDEGVRYTIETGFLEHALETAALRPYFEHWAADPRLQSAWHPALEWGKAHPDYMWNLTRKPLTKTDNE